MVACSKTRQLILAVCAVAMLATVAFGPVCFGQAAGTQSTSPLGSKDIEKAETAVGDLVTDSLRAFTRSDVALIAASELKPQDKPIPAGKLSASDIAPLISYSDDPLAVLQLSGAQIRQALEKAVSIYPQPNLGFLQVSGIKFTFSKDSGAGGRVTSITVGGSPIEESHVYSVAMTNSMANGALGYWKVWPKEKVNVLRRYPDATVLDALKDYLAANSRVDYGTLDRISAK